MRSARYKRVGVTAGFEPAGGGFAQYVRVMDWIVERGVEKIPGRRVVRPGVLGGAGEHVPESGGAVSIRGPVTRWLILGQGPIGLIFTMLVKRKGATTSWRPIPSLSAANSPSALALICLRSAQTLTVSKS